MRALEKMTDGSRVQPKKSGTDGGGNIATKRATTNGREGEVGNSLSQLHDLMQGHGVTITRDLQRVSRPEEGSDSKIVIGASITDKQIEISLHKGGRVYHCMASKREGTLSPQELKKCFGRAGVQVPVVFA